MPYIKDSCHSVKQEEFFEAITENEKFVSNDRFQDGVSDDKNDQSKNYKIIKKKNKF